METPKPKVAVNVFVIKDGKILLGKRKKGFGAGNWGLPGGHLEWMERLVDGAKRELLEETGLKTHDLSFLNMVNDPRPEPDDNSHYIDVNFITKDFDGEPRLLEPEKCHEWRWFEFDSLPENLFIGCKKSVQAFLDKTSFVD